MVPLSCVCIKPIPALNPRYNGSCLTCGKGINGKHIVGDGEVEEFFDMLGRYVPAGQAKKDQTSPIPDFEAFRVHCQIRERWGRHHFAHQYLDRDNPAEAMEEAADLAIYCMLENYGMWRTGFDPDVAASLLDAAHHAALAHAALRRAQQQKRGTPFALTEGGEE